MSEDVIEEMMNQDYATETEVRLVIEAERCMRNLRGSQACAQDARRLFAINDALDLLRRGKVLALSATQYQASDDDTVEEATSGQEASGAVIWGNEKERLRPLTVWVRAEPGCEEDIAIMTCRRCKNGGVYHLNGAAELTQDEWGGGGITVDESLLGWFCPECVALVERARAGASNE